MSNDKTHLGHTARKRFGQNFLHDHYVIDAIVAAIHPQEGQVLVEIGPGLGALTEPVASQLSHMHVVELDRDLAERLRHHPVLKDKLTIHEADAMKFDFNTLKQDGQPLRVFGNLPYNISTPLMFHLFEQSGLISDMHFMLQKEVVDRMVAEPGTADYGRLSVMLQYRFSMERILDVPPESFNPPPKVDSAVVRMIPYDTLPHRAQDEALLAHIVQVAFAQRRKTLRNNLKGVLDDDGFTALDIDPGIRPENLSVGGFVAIANYLSEKA